MADLARWQASLQDNKGNLVLGASIRVERRVTGTPLASIYEDRAASTPLGNPFICSDGHIVFHASGGLYKIEATKDGITQTWDYVPIGLAQEVDNIIGGIPWFFSTTVTDSDPGAGNLRLNNATLSSVTEVYISELAASGVDFTDWLTSFDDGGQSSARGTILIQSQDGTAIFLATVTGSVIDGTDYRKLSVTPVVTAGTFINGAAANIQFYTTGIDGDGDVTGPAGGVVDNEFVLYNSTTGKLIKGSSYLVASVSEVRSSAANRLMNTALIESASAIVTISDAATVAVDWDTFINGQVTLAGNRTLGNPTNGQPGTWRTIEFIQDGTGSRTLAFGGNYVFPGGSAPVLSTGAGERDRLMIFCATTSRFEVYSQLDLS